LDILGEKMNVALAEKQKCQDEADATAFIIDLANRLINGLASENIRWAETVQLYVGLLPYKIVIRKEKFVLNKRKRRSVKH